MVIKVIDNYHKSPVVTITEMVGKGEYITSAMYFQDIKKLTEENRNFRKVLYTGKHSQIVAMSISVGDDIGEETHPQTDQILFIVDGEGEAVVNGVSRKIEEHDVIFVPAGVKHNFINRGDEDLKLFTVYSPPAHKDGTIHVTKEDAKKGEY